MAKKKTTTSSKKKAARLAPKASRSSGVKKKAKAAKTAKKVSATKKTKKASKTAKRNVQESSEKMVSEKKSPSKKSSTETKASSKKAVGKMSTDQKPESKKLARRPKKKSMDATMKTAASDGEAMEIYEEPKIPKTKLTEKQLKTFRQMLIEKRRELLGDVRMLTRDALGKPRQESAGDLSNVPIHMADVGSDNWEQDFTIGLIANERQLVREIDHALERIEDRTYGVCLGTLKRISVARLRAKPWAKYSIEYARELEQRRG